MSLTDTACRNAKCPEGRAFVRLADAGGLYLEVTQPGPKSPKGSKRWRWKYRVGGKEKLLALGLYPDVPLASGMLTPSDGGISQLVKGHGNFGTKQRPCFWRALTPARPGATPS